MTRARRVLRRGQGAARRVRPAVGRAAAAQHPRRPGPRRLPAADLHRDDHRPPGRVLRDHRAPRRRGLRRGQLQGAVRGDRARPGPPRQPADVATPDVAYGSSVARDAQQPDRRHPGLPAGQVGRRGRRPSTGSPRRSSWPPTSRRSDRCPASPTRSPRRSRRSTVRRPHGDRRSPSATPSIDRRRPRPRRRRRRLGRPDRAARAVVRRAGRRGRVPVAELHRLPAVHEPRRRRRPSIRRCAVRRSTSTRCVGAITDEHATRARRQPEQPDRHRGAHRRPASGSSTPRRRTASS